MTAIIVDPQRLVECAGHVCGAQGEILRGADILARGLAGSSGMAGNDPAGAEWAAAYDPAAGKLLALAADLANRMGAHVHALNESAMAYQASEGWFGGTPGALVPVQSHGDAWVLTVPEACGGQPFASSDQVIQQIVQLVGTVWPNGDTGLLRTASTQWAALSSTLDTARRSSLSSSLGSLDGLASPTVTAASDRGLELDRALGDLGAGASELSAACHDLAVHIDDTHQEVQREIASLTAELGITVLLSTLTSAVTAGLSAVIGSVASAGRVAVAVARVTAMFERLASLARPIANKIAGLKQALEALAGRISGWARGRLPQPLRRLSIDGFATRAETVTNHWSVTLLTQGPTAAVSKVLEKPLTAFGAHLGASAARRALVLGWRADLPGVRGILVRAGQGPAAPASEPLLGPLDADLRGTRGAHVADRPGVAAVDRALRSARTESLAARADRALERPSDAAKGALTSAADDAIDSAMAPPENPADGGDERPTGWTVDVQVPHGDVLRMEIPKSLDLGHGVGLDLSAKRVTGVLGMDVEVKLPGPAGKLVDSGLNVVNAVDLTENWWKERVDASAAVAARVPHA